MDRQKLNHQMEMGGRFKGGGSLGRPWATGTRRREGSALGLQRLRAHGSVVEACTTASGTCIPALHPGTRHCVRQSAHPGFLFSPALCLFGRDVVHTTAGI